MWDVRHPAMPGCATRTHTGAAGGRGTVQSCCLRRHGRPTQLGDGPCTAGDSDGKRHWGKSRVTAQAATRRGTGLPAKTLRGESPGSGRIAKAHRRGLTRRLTREPPSRPPNAEARPRLCPSPRSCLPGPPAESDGWADRLDQLLGPQLDDALAAKQAEFDHRWVGACACGRLGAAWHRRRKGTGEEEKHGLPSNVVSLLPVEGAEAASRGVPSRLRTFRV
jgi:hypothetical protein